MEMFRLKEQQLHSIIWVMVVVTVAFFGFFGLGKPLMNEHSPALRGLTDLSDGWVATYETTDKEKLAEYQKSSFLDQGKEVPKEEQFHILEVLTTPATLSLRTDTQVVMTHLVPVIEQEAYYLVMELDNAKMQVFIEDQMIYSSNDKEQMVPVKHVIPLLPEYSNSMLTIRVTDVVSDELTIEGFTFGNYNQLLVSMIQKDGFFIVIGFVLLLWSFTMFLIWVLVKNTWQQKRVLFYGSMEGLLLGACHLACTQLIPIMTGWNYGTFILRSCIILISTILHLMIVRCFVYKKKVLTIVDVAVLLVAVLYISVMVLQAFSLLHFDAIYYIVFGVYWLVVLAFTIVLSITIFDYKRKEGMPIFVANVVLLLCGLCQIIMHFAGRQMRVNISYISVGLAVYIIYVCMYGIKQAFYVVPKKEEKPIDEKEIREKMIEQMNPNLLFASFQTLQNLIKNGSDKSVKMIYYISVYVRDNFKALESEGDIVSFQEELEHIIAYLQLQKTRNHQMDYAIECKVKEFQVPRHSIEPFVENAVKHGLYNHGNKGNVVIRTYMRQDGYAIQIIDDGAGFDTTVLKKKTTTLAKKLMLLEQKCNAKTEVISRPDKGTVITIVLPMLENDLLEE
ncbi:MAG: hypothetical protein E7264_08450 [Lachnospiraceae bacterium]|nr:hypothetical protein [Lachnospiraceae bacterium]